jgi:hypothetical protein
MGMVVVVVGELFFSRRGEGARFFDEVRSDDSHEELAHCRCPRIIDPRARLIDRNL